jgi:pimeloyl-ACP methyl ester carboxylesterase
VIVSYLRGYDTTRFLSSETVRDGQQSALAVDVIALMDALTIEKAILAGFDWRARTADIVAALSTTNRSSTEEVLHVDGGARAGRW